MSRAGDQIGLEWRSLGPVFEVETRDCAEVGIGGDYRTLGQGFRDARDNRIDDRNGSAAPTKISGDPAVFARRRDVEGPDNQSFAGDFKLLEVLVASIAE